MNDGHHHNIHRGIHRQSKWKIRRGTRTECVIITRTLPSRDTFKSQPQINRRSRVDHTYTKGLLNEMPLFRRGPLGQKLPGSLFLTAYEDKWREHREQQLNGMLRG
ncbi:hypothetical protein TNCV_1325441 [Trichonephila clavipes]|nr:hypothetical protein TNCV_1325441 [Trichonephila clavipes]